MYTLYSCQNLIIPRRPLPNIRRHHQTTNLTHLMTGQGRLTVTTIAGNLRLTDTILVAPIGQLATRNRVKVTAHTSLLPILN